MEPKTIGNFIYFTDARGDLYRAPVGSPDDVITGFPMGARFESPPHLAAWYLQHMTDLQAEWDNES